MEFSALGSCTPQASLGRNYFCGPLSGLQNKYLADLSPHPTSSIRHPFCTSSPRTPHLTSHSTHPFLISKHQSTWQRGLHARFSSRQHDRCSSHGCQRLCCVSALPEYAGTLATVAVAASVGALVLINREGLSAGLKLNQLPCATCQGSGLCPACNGEGFQNRNPGRIEAAKLRAGSPTAATRYTAGLAKKWKYCDTCNGGRGCVACDGRGRVDPPKEPQQPPV